MVKRVGVLGSRRYLFRGFAFLTEFARVDREAYGVVYIELSVCCLQPRTASGLGDGLLSINTVSGTEFSLDGVSLFVKSNFFNGSNSSSAFRDRCLR
jgi:hypothetical protein